MWQIAMQKRTIVLSAAAPNSSKADSLQALTWRIQEVASFVCRVETILAEWSGLWESLWNNILNSKGAIGIAFVHQIYLQYH